MPKASWVFQLHADERAIAHQFKSGLEANIFVGEKIMLSVVRCGPHSIGPLHSHPEEQWGVLLEGECVRIQNDEEVLVEVGDLWHTPSGVPHGVRAGANGCVILDIFSPPRAALMGP